MKYGTDLDRQRHGDRLLHGLDQFRVLVFHRLGRLLRIGGDEVDVQLHRIHARILHRLGVPRPAADRSAVEAADDRHLDLLLGRLDQVQVLLGPGVVRVEFGEVRQRFRERLRLELVQLVHFLLVVFDLLLEQRRQHGGCRAGFFQTAERIGLAAQGTGRHDQRVLQREPQIFG